jgi:HME family heavy-metal exporter
VALREAAEATRARLAAVPGLADVQVEPQVEVAQQRIRIDARSAAQYGIAPARAQEALVSLSLGRPLSQIVEGARRHDFVLRLPEAQREAASIPDLLVDGVNGSVPLRLIADIEQGRGPNQLLHEDGRRRIAISAWAADGRLDRASRAAGTALAALPLPAGIERRIEGEASSARAATTRIAALALLALLLMATLLQQRYRSAVLTAILLVNLPLALVGGVAALALTDTPLSVASLVGFVTLAGIAARNGILKLSHYRQLIRDEGMAFGQALILRGAVERLRPVTMTALIAALALAPLLWQGAAPGKEILHPVALVIFGGLLSSTLLDAFLTPLLVARFGGAALVPSPIDDRAF